MIFLRCCIVSVLVLATMPASEVVRKDMNVAFELLPTAFDYTLDEDLPPRSGSDSFTRAMGLRIGPRIAAAGPGESVSWIGGAEARVGDYTYSSYGSYRTYGLGVTAGVGWAFADQWLLSLEPIAEIGIARLAFGSNPSFSAMHAKGAHMAYGGRLGIMYTWQRSWVFGIEGGYLGITSDLTNDQNQPMSFSQRGPVAALTFAWRWDYTPRVLE